mmetsp:Transcript_12386/g.23331  ORF Transcript_12386/g.23331 Transcript_12386/m.23331 type:complete len:156 (+) Transcript_12386:169-636(+)|eukprot:CAMPEP_0197471842 /NCGR_PEP_ID=MMETSP1309-20131121/2855_1 /TAXON_ID=464262 /ORGANISM="Genus nov. species nov., Strain RCC998" /LENGTH=155 /DNA_ID=CAMNT_0043009873 /DNA_START=162 /DNA_END=629 /DNA_ORIENTATION=+
MMQIVTKKASTSAAIAARKTTVASRSANALPALNARRNLSTVSKRMNKDARSSSVVVQSKIDTDEIISTVTEKWDSVENKPQAIIYAGGAFVAIVIVNSIVGAINGLPLFPKIFELVGLGYSAWFTYKYLLFKSSRAELLADIEELKAKVLNSGE